MPNNQDAIIKQIHQTIKKAPDEIELDPYKTEGRKLDALLVNIYSTLNDRIEKTTAKTITLPDTELWETFRPNGTYVGKLADGIELDGVIGYFTGEVVNSYIVLGENESYDVLTIKGQNFDNGKEYIRTIKVNKQSNNVTDTGFVEDKVAVDTLTLMPDYQIFKYNGSDIYVTKYHIAKILYVQVSGIIYDYDVLNSTFNGNIFKIGSSTDANEPVAYTTPATESLPPTPENPNGVPADPGDPNGLETEIKILYLTGNLELLGTPGYEFDDIPTLNSIKIMRSGKIKEALDNFKIDLVKAKFLENPAKWTDFKETGLYYGILSDNPGQDSGSLILADIKALDNTDQFGNVHQTNVIKAVSISSGRIYYRVTDRHTHPTNGGSGVGLGVWKSYDTISVISLPERWDDWRETRGIFYGELEDGPIPYGGSIIACIPFEISETLKVQHQYGNSVQSGKTYSRTVRYLWNVELLDFEKFSTAWVSPDESLKVSGTPVNGAVPVWDSTQNKTVWQIPGVSTNYDNIYVVNPVTGNDNTALPNNFTRKWKTAKAASLAAFINQTGGIRNQVWLESGLYPEHSINQDGIDIHLEPYAFVYSDVVGMPVISDKHLNKAIRVNITGEGQFYHLNNNPDNDSEGINFKYGSTWNIQFKRVDSIQIWGNNTAKGEFKGGEILFGFLHHMDKYVNFYNCKFLTGVSLPQFSGHTGAGSTIEFHNCELIQQDISTADLLNVKDVDGNNVLTLTSTKLAGQLDVSNLTPLEVANIVDTTTHGNDFLNAISFNENIYNSWGGTFHNYKVRFFNPIIRIKRSKGIAIKAIRNFDNLNNEFIITNPEIIDETPDSSVIALVRGRKPELSSSGFIFHTKGISNKIGSILSVIPTGYIDIEDSYQTFVSASIPQGNNTMPVIVLDPATGTYKQVAFPVWNMPDISQLVQDTYMTDINVNMPGNVSSTSTLSENIGVLARLINELKALSKKEPLLISTTTIPVLVNSTLETVMFNENIAFSLLAPFTRIEYFLDFTKSASAVTGNILQVLANDNVILERSFTTGVATGRFEGVLQIQEIINKQYHMGSTNTLSAGPTNTTTTGGYSERLIDLSSGLNIKIKAKLESASITESIRVFGFGLSLKSLII